MARSTGPILLAGTLHFADEVIFQNKPIDWMIPVATGLAVGMFSLAESVVGEPAVIAAWLAVTAVLLTSPVVSHLAQLVGAPATNPGAEAPAHP